MKTKTLLYLGVSLVALIAIILLSEQLSSGKSSEKTKSFFPGFSSEKCSAFRISDSKEIVKIIKKGQSWFVVGSAETKSGKPSVLGQADTSAPKTGASDYPADSSSAVSVLEKLTTMRMDDLISDNPQKQKLFEVDSAQGTLVEVWDNNNTLTGSFYIGKNGPSWDNHYVRTKGTNDVYSVGGSIKYSFFTDSKRWKDKTAMKFDKSLAKKITVAKKDSASIVIEKTVDSLKNPLWSITAPEKDKGKAKIDAVNKVLDGLCNLMTADWEENAYIADTATGLEKPSFAVTIDLENGDKKFVTVGREKPNTSQAYVKTSYKNDLFLIYKSTFSEMEKGVNEYKEKKDSVATAAPQKTTPAPVKPAAVKKEEAKAKKK